MKTEMTNQDCIYYFTRFLKENSVRENMITLDEDEVKFKVKDTEYIIKILSKDNIEYGVYKVDDVDLSDDFWESKIEYGDYTHIEDFFYGIVKENYYGFVKKIWKSLEKLEKDFETEEDLDEIVSKFFERQKRVIR